MIFLTTLILIYTFLCPLAWAGPSFNISSEYGLIKEEFGYVSGSAQAKTIIYIQDAHCNFEAQKNIANILEGLIRDNGIKLVFVEGGTGDAGLSYLRGYGSKDSRRLIAEQKLKEGKISGEEYLDIVSDLNFQIYGIEEARLYNEQRDAFLKIDSHKNELLNFAENAQAICQELKAKIYNEKLKELESKRKSFENNEITLISYIDYLNGLCLKYAVKSSDYSDFSKLAEAVSQEKRVDYDLIGKEANAVLNNLVKVLPEKERASLLEEAKSLADKDQKQAYDFYIKIKGLAQRKYVNLAAYQNFENFTSFLQAFDFVNMDSIFSDIESINRQLTRQLAGKTEEWQIIDIDYGISVFKKMVNIKLDKSGFDSYSRKKELVNPKAWSAALNNLALKYGLNPLKVAANIEDAFNQLEHFYQLAFQRDTAFVEKIFSKMQEQGINKAVLITGGFHSNNLQTLLEQGGASGVVVYPKVSQLTDDKLYFSRVKEELSELEKMVAGR